MTTTTCTREAVDHNGRPHWQYTYHVLMADGSTATHRGPTLLMGTRDRLAHRARPYADMAREVEAEQWQRNHDEIEQRSNA